MNALIRVNLLDRPWIPIIGAALLLACAAWASPEVLTGTIVNMTADTGERATESFTIHIDRTTPDTEFSAMVGVSQRRGQTGLQEMLWELKPKGRIRIGTSLGYPLGVIRSSIEGGRRVIRILTDRPLQYYEVVNAQRTRDYPYSYLEITLDEHGRGEGTFVPVAKVSFKPDGEFEVQNYTALPFKLIKVRSEGEAQK